MSQGFNVVFKREGERGEEGAVVLKHGGKLNELSLINDPVAEYLTSTLFKEKARVYCVGDYGNLKLDWKVAHTFDITQQQEVPWRRLYLINYTKKQYIDMNKYLDKKHYDKYEETWIYPLTILTAVGVEKKEDNKGNYDYDGIYAKYTGYWAGDVVSFRANAPRTFKELDIHFAHKYIK